MKVINKVSIKACEIIDETPDEVSAETSNVIYETLGEAWPVNYGAHTKTPEVVKEKMLKPGPHWTR